MTEWKQFAEHEYFENHRIIKDIASDLSDCFPKLSERQRYDKVQGYIRRRKKYHDGPVEAIQKKPAKSWKRISDKTGEEEHSGVIQLEHGDNATPEEIIRAHGLDPKLWVCTGYTNNVWQANAGEGKAMNLYQSKIRVKPITPGNMPVEQVVEAVRAAVEDFNPPKVNIHKPDKHGLCLEVPIADLHFGKLCWAGETASNYDHKIAAENFHYIIDDVISWVKQLGVPVSLIWYPVGNDFFNSDTIGGDTAHGTPQDNDVRWQKMFTEGFKCLAEGAQKLSNIAPVDAFYMPGNHDTMASFYATFALEQAFKDHKRVTVDSSAFTRKYRRYGNTLVCFTHGDTATKRLGESMLLEAREDFGNTKYHEIHRFHLHDEAVERNKAGIIERVMPSVCGEDAWHTESGYVKAEKRSLSLLYDKQHGLKYSMYTTIE